MPKNKHVRAGIDFFTVLTPFTKNPVSRQHSCLSCTVSQEAETVFVDSLGRVSVEEIMSVFAQLLLLLFLALGIEEGKQIQKVRIGRVRCKAGVVVCQVLGNRGRENMNLRLRPSLREQGEEERERRKNGKETARYIKILRFGAMLLG